MTEQKTKGLNPNAKRGTRSWLEPVPTLFLPCRHQPPSHQPADGENQARKRFGSGTEFLSQMKKFLDAMRSLAGDADAHWLEESIETLVHSNAEATPFQQHFPWLQRIMSSDRGMLIIFLFLCGVTLFRKQVGKLASVVLYWFGASAHTLARPLCRAHSSPRTATTLTRMTWTCNLTRSRQPWTSSAPLWEPRSRRQASPSPPPSWLRRMRKYVARPSQGWRSPVTCFRPVPAVPSPERPIVDVTRVRPEGY